MEFTTTEKGNLMVICMYSKRIWQTKSHLGSVFFVEINVHMHPPSQMQVEVVISSIKRKSTTTQDASQ